MSRDKKVRKKITKNGMKEKQMQKKDRDFTPD